MRLWRFPNDVSFTASLRLPLPMPDRRQPTSVVVQQDDIGVPHVGQATKASGLVVPGQLHATSDNDADCDDSDAGADADSNDVIQRRQNVGKVFPEEKEATERPG